MESIYTLFFVFFPITDTIRNKGFPYYLFGDTNLFRLFIFYNQFENSKCNYFYQYLTSSYSSIILLVSYEQYNKYMKLIMTLNVHFRLSNRLVEGYICKFHLFRTIVVRNILIESCAIHSKSQACDGDNINYTYHRL